MACEMDQDCRKVYSATFPELPTEQFISNIRALTRHDMNDEDSLCSGDEIDALVPDHDLLCAGFPCQPFSKSGGQKGFSDRTRGTLFFDILQIVRAKKPRYLFLENVRNLTGPRHADTWATIVSSLREEGYVVSDTPLVLSPHLLPYKMGGTPQVRERVFILGIRADADTLASAESTIDQVYHIGKQIRNKNLFDPDCWRIADFLDSDASIDSVERYYVSSNEAMYLEAWDYFVRNIPVDTLPGFPIWTFAFSDEPELEDGMASWEVGFRTKNSRFYTEHRVFIDEWMDMTWGERQLKVSEFSFSRQKFEWQARKQHPSRTDRTLRDLVIQFRPSGIRVKPPTYVPALVAITQTSVVGPALRDGGERYRKLTPLEASRLQRIPERVYSRGVVDDAAAYKQLGNAVCAGLIEAVGAVLLGASKRAEGQSVEQIGLPLESPAACLEDQLV